MKNYERYKSVNAEDYDRRSVMSVLCRIPSDKKILPYISELKGKKILDVGIGTGYYTKFLLPNNVVHGVDQNPHLCKVPVKLYKGDASELTGLLENEKYDIVISTWMTEYLDETKLGRFFSESKRALNDNGMLITTMISKYGLGFIYITLARLLKGIDKYNYHKKKTEEELKKAGFRKITIINLDSWFHFPWAYMVIAE